MVPTIEVPLFESIATGLAWLGVIGVFGMLAVVALVASSAPTRRESRPRATVVPLTRRISKAA